MSNLRRIICERSLQWIRNHELPWWLQVTRQGSNHAIQLIPLSVSQIWRWIHARMVSRKWNLHPVRWHEIRRRVSRWAHLGPWAGYLQRSVKRFPTKRRLFSGLQTDSKEKLSRHCAASAKNCANGKGTMRTTKLIWLFFVTCSAEIELSDFMQNKSQISLSQWKEDDDKTVFWHEFLTSFKCLGLQFDNVTQKLPKVVSAMKHARLHSWTLNIKFWPHFAQMASRGYSTLRPNSFVEIIIRMSSLLFYEWKLRNLVNEQVNRAKYSNNIEFITHNATGQLVKIKLALRGQSSPRRWLRLLGSGATVQAFVILRKK